jgi:hypothetical protein
MPKTLNENLRKKKREFTGSDRKRLDLQEKVARPQFPTKDGMWQPPAILWKQMCAVYGARLIEIECQNINLWLVKHPGGWKTARGMPRFLNLWFGRASKTVKIAQNRPTDAWMSQGAADMPPLELEMLRADLDAKAKAAQEQFNRIVGRVQ